MELMLLSCKLRAHSLGLLRLTPPFERVYADHAKQLHTTRYRTVLINFNLVVGTNRVSAVSNPEQSDSGAHYSHTKGLASYIMYQLTILIHVEIITL